MKRTFLILVFVLYNIYSGIAQSQYTLVNTVKTPHGSTVTDTGIFTGTDVSYNAAQLAALANQIAAGYNGAVLVGPPTDTYNCHAYAWHITEGGGNVWLGLYSTTAHSIYWTDKSYVEVPENAATKVVYTGNHSAIKIDSNWYQSKWGASALVKHHLNNVPTIYLPSSTKHYYKRAFSPVITGTNPSVLNVNATYSVTVPPSGITFVGWTVTPSTFVATGGLNNQNLTVRFTAATTYTLSANFTLPNGSTCTATRSVSLLKTKPDKPSIYGGRNVQQVSLPGYTDPVFWAQPGTTVEFTIYNAHQYGSQVIFDWLVPSGTHTGKTYTYNIPSGNGEGIHGVWCIANDGGTESDPGLSYLYISSVSPMSMPVKAQKALVEQLKAMPKSSKEEFERQKKLFRQ